MRILHIYKDFYPPVAGGMERHIALLCRHQAAWAEVSALVCSRTVRTRVRQVEGVPVTEVGEWGRVQRAPVSPAFPWHVARAQADVLVVHMPNPTAELACLLARTRAPIVVRYHSDVVRQAVAMRVYAPVMRAFLRRAALVLPTSQQYLDTSPHLQAVRERCRVVPLGIDTAPFAETDTAAVAALHARYGDPFVLFAGVHRYYKGLHVLLEAAAAIDAPVVIAGDGPERARLEELARRVHAPVTFAGRLSEAALVAHYQAAAVFAFPSVARSEAFGLTILEAHAAGTPVVATRLGTGVEYANEDGRTGLNVAPGDPGALAGAVNALLADAARRAEMGAYARARVARAFDGARIARAEFEAYEDARRWATGHT